MKKIILVFVFGIGLLSTAVAQRKLQLDITDTLAYLKSIEARKVEFIGQPFSKLLNELQINIVRFNSIGMNYNNMWDETGASFKFVTGNDEREDFPYLSIDWAGPPYHDVRVSDSIYNKTKRLWTSEVKEHYKDYVVDALWIVGTQTKFTEESGGLFLEPQITQSKKPATHQKIKPKKKKR